MAKGESSARQIQPSSVEFRAVLGFLVPVFIKKGLKLEKAIKDGHFEPKFKISSVIRLPKDTEKSN